VVDVRTGWEGQCYTGTEAEECADAGCDGSKGDLDEDDEGWCCDGRRDEACGASAWDDDWTYSPTPFGGGDSDAGDEGEDDSDAGDEDEDDCEIGRWYCEDCNCKDVDDAEGLGDAPDGYNQCCPGGEDFSDSDTDTDAGDEDEDTDSDAGDEDEGGQELPPWDGECYDVEDTGYVVESTGETVKCFEFAK